jgi:glycosyltransferase involved in cell wall biosynthesis
MRIEDAEKYLDIAVLIPCYNEEATIKKVVNDFQLGIPSALVYVYNNASTDGTVEIATKAGAIVRTEPNKGKGNVMRRMFSDIEADIYIIVDGDDTYEASKCLEMVNKLIDSNLDMVIASRKTENSEGEYRWGHVFGNRMLTRSVSLIFGHGFTDMLSGYRVMSHRFVKSFPIASKGFEIETEITIHALQIGASCAEIETLYDSRPEGSESKLNTFKDGFKILWMILILFKEGKPFQFFGLLSLFFFIISVVLSISIFSTYIETGMVPKIPTAVLSTGLMILSFFSLIAGVILDSLSRSRLEVKRANYLSYKSPKVKL